MGAITGSRMIQLSEDSIGRSPVFIYCTVIAAAVLLSPPSVVGVAATDIIAESSAKDDPSLPSPSALQGFTVCYNDSCKNSYTYPCDSYPHLHLLEPQLGLWYGPIQ